jgi:hypothetical protein
MITSCSARRFQMTLTNKLFVAFVFLVIAFSITRAPQSTLVKVICFVALAIMCGFALFRY